MARLSVLLLCSALLAAASTDPVELFAPWGTVSDADRERLAGGEVIVRLLEADGGQLAVLALTRLDAPPEALVAWTHAIAELKRSAFVHGVGRFHEPPRLSDLDGLHLDGAELEALRGCAPQDCALRLSAAEIASLREVVAGAGAGWREAIAQEFRRLLFARLTLYRTHGLAALPPTAHRSAQVSFAESFNAVLTASPYLTRVPRVLGWLEDGRATNHADVDSFFYWSQEYFGAGKPVISVTHVGILRSDGSDGMPAVLVISKQIFSTHYVNAALGITAVLTDAGRGTRYLAYLNRSEINPLKGFLGFFRRAVAEDRIERDTPELVRTLRRRIESGPPPHDEAKELKP